MRKESLDFTDERIERLTFVIIDLKKVLHEIGRDWSFELNNILSAAIKKDSELFRQHVLTNSLFGGAGALWELYCPNAILLREFQNKFIDFCMELKSIGIHNGRINQVLDGLLSVIKQ